MKERPILFSATMVRAILDGRKTMTRRIIKPQPANGTIRMYAQESADFLAQTGWWYAEYLNAGRRWTDGALHKCPYGVIGDRLWGRERWRIGAWDENAGLLALDFFDGPQKKWLTIPDDVDGVMFEKLWRGSCDELCAKGVNPNKLGDYFWKPGESPLRWRPSIHMPRWASRITLEITGVRVERLLNISEADAVREGVENISPNEWRDYRDGGSTICPCASFFTLWRSIYGRESLDSNPLVWVVEFRRIKP